MKHFIILILFIASLITSTLYIYNIKQAQRREWEPLITVDKNIPEVTNEVLTLFYKSKDGLCGLSVLVEISNEDRDGILIIKNIIILLDKQLVRSGWYAVEYQELQAKRNYALTISHDRTGKIIIDISSGGGKYYRAVFRDTEAEMVVNDIWIRLFGVEV